MKTRFFPGFIFSLLLTALFSGCVTKKLWTDTPSWDCWNQPAVDPHLRLFQTKKDFLVVYDEYSERHDSIHSRAYLLRKNQKHVEKRLEPAFVERKLIRTTKPVPVITAAEVSPANPVPFAVLETNRHAFVLFLGENVTNRCELPVYDDGQGKTMRIAFTPLAATADLTIVGGFLGYLYLQGMAGGGGYNPSY